MASIYTKEQLDYTRSISEQSLRNEFLELLRQKEHAENRAAMLEERYKDCLNNQALLVDRLKNARAKTYTHSIKSIIFLIFSYIGIYNLGLYTVMNLTGIPIAPYRWVITSMITLFFVILSRVK